MDKFQRCSPSLLRRYFCNDRTRYRRKDDNITITGGLGSVMWLLEIVSKFYSVEFKGAEPLLQLLPTILWNLFLPIYVLYSLNKPRMNNGCSGQHYSLSWLRVAMQNRWIREGKDLGKMIWTRHRRNSNARLERINVVGQMLIWLQVIRLLCVHCQMQNWHTKTTVSIYISYISKDYEYDYVNLHPHVHNKYIAIHIIEDVHHQSIIFYAILSILTHIIKKWIILIHSIIFVL